jgi:diguanylate cyclase (GGDEF)-like protein/PAS domain S-box-containing protein
MRHKAETPILTSSPETGGRDAKSAGLRPGSKVAAENRAGTTTLPGPQVSGGSFVVDRAGGILAFDRNLERLTGWSAEEIVGTSRETGVYDSPDDLGLRRFERRILYSGQLPQPQQTTLARLRIHTKSGGHFETEVLVTPIGRDGSRFAVEVQRVLARVSPPAASPGSQDPLTRVAGPDTFRARLVEDLARAHAGKCPLSLLLVEIDDFDALVQGIGRQRAGEVLQRSAGTIYALVRRGDLVARVKEDCFAVVLAGAGRGEARAVGERIRAAFGDFGVGIAAEPAMRFTASAGIASYPADGEDAAELVRRCGEALAEAKRLGQNRVWSYSRSSRVPAHVPVYFDGPAAHLLGRGRDLSNSGLFVETAEDLRVGMRLGMMFQLPGQSEPVRCVGRIARKVTAGEDALSPPGLGIEFERYGTRDRERIEAHIERVKVSQNRRRS